MALDKHDTNNKLSRPVRRQPDPRHSEKNGISAIRTRGFLEPSRCITIDPSTVTLPCLVLVDLSQTAPVPIARKYGSCTSRMSPTVGSRLICGPFFTLPFTVSFISVARSGLKAAASHINARIHVSHLRLLYVACTRRPRLRWSSLHTIASNKAADLTSGQCSRASNALCGAGMRACTCSRMSS